MSLNPYFSKMADLASVRVQRFRALMVTLTLAGLVMCQTAWGLSSSASPNFAVVQASDSSQPQTPPADLTNASIEDLMNMEVTSVSKKEQKISRTPAAVFVITGEDIRHSGATNIPDVLRMVPGLDVAQINANTWAIAARGLNGEFSNELLVLLDGRNVYTPTFGGVFWDVLDVPLEDIERIEVIRGPGGLIWGANAVNGVINIITKKASETKGGIVSTGGGNLDQGFGTVQFGGSAGSTTSYRIYSKYLNQDQSPSVSGQSGGDGWHLLDTGFRTDSALSGKDTLSVQGGMYTGREGDPSTTLPSVTTPGLVDFELAVNLSGGFLQGVWNHTFSDRADTTLRVSYDTYTRSDQLGETRRLGDIEFRNHLMWGNRQDLIWGLQYTNTVSDSHGDLFVSLNPNHQELQEFSAFVQDEIAIVPDRAYLTVGTRLLNSYYGSWNLLPTARITYALNTRNMIWAAVSRAIRTPAAIDTSVRLDFAGFPGPAGMPILIAELGNPYVQSGDLLAYEFGYRATINDRLSVDLAAFYNDYTHLETLEPAPPFFEAAPAPPHLVVPTTYENLEFAHAQGAEIFANWKINGRWTISPGYAVERLHAATLAGSQDTTTPLEDQGSAPDVQAQVRSHFQISKALDWNTSAYFVDRVLLNNIPAYTRVDSGVTWRCKEGLSLSFVGQNLLRDQHLEFIDPTGASRSTEIKRSAYAKLTWQF
jgi:iron complex outermembrane recepter protein